MLNLSGDDDNGGDGDDDGVHEAQVMERLLH